MKTKMKTASILLGTFFIGGVLGFILHATFIRNDFREHALRMRTPEGFIHRFEKVIEPTDAQRKEIRKILNDHFQEMVQHQDEFRSRMDLVRKDIEALLTEEQKERLKKDSLLERDSNSKSRRRDRQHHKPFDAPPPPPDSLM
ncbi:hypothetical protein HQ585_00820 [candidate division KSB1 bacterium]|nr:hypothetical protein [candidate division KSB1 bacterium]